MHRAGNDLPDDPSGVRVARRGTGWPERYLLQVDLSRCSVWSCLSWSDLLSFDPVSVGWLQVATCLVVHGCKYSLAQQEMDGGGGLCFRRLGTMAAKLELRDAPLAMDSQSDQFLGVLRDR